MTAAIDQYTEYYGEVELAKWRELGPRDKAANVMKLWSTVSPETYPTIVDIGCGDGAVIHELDRLGWGRSYVGFEVSQSGLACARQQRHVKPAYFAQYDEAHLPVLQKSFDLAILRHVLEHVEAPRSLLREAARVARHVFVEVPLELNPRTLCNYSWTKVGHTNFYNPLLIRHLVQSTGMRVLAERVTCPSLEVISFRRPGVAGILHYTVKAAPIKVVPDLAYRMLTYHGCLIASSSA